MKKKEIFIRKKRYNRSNKNIYNFLNNKLAKTS